MLATHLSANIKGLRSLPACRELVIQICSLRSQETMLARGLARLRSRTRFRARGSPGIIFTTASRTRYSEYAGSEGTGRYYACLDAIYPSVNMSTCLSKTRITTCVPTIHNVYHVLRNCGTHLTL